MTINLLYPPYPAGTIDYPGGTLAVQVNETVTLDEYPPPENALLRMIMFAWDPVAAQTEYVLASTHGYVMLPLETVADEDAQPDLNQAEFPAGLSESFNYQAALFAGVDPGQSSGSVGAGFGEVVLNDPAGEWDRQATVLDWPGRKLSILRGSGLGASQQRVAALQAEQLLYGSNEKRIKVTDRQTFYDVPLLDRYDGSGGINGEAAIKGHVRPQTYGQVFNIEPKLINVAKLIYQYHDRRAQGVLAVRDGAAPFTETVSATTYDELAAADVPVGRFAQCKELGLLRLGSQPGLSLRIDAKGDAALFTGEVPLYQQTRANIVRKIAVSRGPSPVADVGVPSLPKETDGVDHLAFIRMNTLQPGTVGFYFNQDVTIGAALDHIMAGIGGWWRTKLAHGQLTVDQIALPDRPHFALDWPADFKSEPELVSASQPRWRTRIGWRHNLAPQAKSDLGAVTPAQEQLYGEEWSFADSKDEEIKTRYPKATDVEMPAEYANEGDAVAEATRQQALFGVRRERWKVSVRLDPFADVLGKTVMVRGYSRLGFGDRLMIVVGAQAVAGIGDVTLDLWG